MPHNKRGSGRPKTDPNDAPLPTQSLDTSVKTEAPAPAALSATVKHEAPPSVKQEPATPKQEPVSPVKQEPASPPVSPLDLNLNESTTVQAKVKKNNLTSTTEQLQKELAKAAGNGGQGAAAPKDIQMGNALALATYKSDGDPSKVPGETTKNGNKKSLEGQLDEMVKYYQSNFQVPIRINKRPGNRNCYQNTRSKKKLMDAAYLLNSCSNVPLLHGRGPDPKGAQHGVQDYQAYEERHPEEVREEGAGGRVWSRRALRYRGDADRVQEEHHPAGRQGHGDRQDPRRHHQLHQAQVLAGCVQTDHTPRQASALYSAARACCAADAGRNCRVTAQWP